jgi:hypothetical protein
MPLEMGKGDQKDPKQAAHKHFRDMAANYFKEAHHGARNEEGPAG